MNLRCLRNYFNITDKDVNYVANFVVGRPVIVIFFKKPNNLFPNIG